MANIFTNLNLIADSNFFITQKINSIGYVGENTVTRLNIEVPEITEGAVYELETENSAGEKNVALLSVDVENNNLYLDFTARMLTVNDLIMMQLRVTYADNSIKKSNRFAMKIAKSISATDYYEEYAVSIFDQLVQDCRDIIEGAESYAVRAETAAVNAEAYSESASASAEAASTSASTASTSATTATTAAETATAASTSASTSAETATTAANSASTSATTAQTSAQTAQSASVTAQSASETAQTASTAATSAATNAETAANTATTAASNASASATAAASSATAANNSATSASTSASNAAASETNAATSASNAANSASSASTSATNAANSATAAATSATNAHNSEVNASTSETNASASAAEAEASAESIAASVSQINENTYRINDLEAIIAGYQLADLPAGAVANITNGTALLMPSLKVGIEPVQEGSGDPSPENIRPISGHTEANITRTGKNIWGGETLADAFYGATSYIKDTNTKTVNFSTYQVAPYHLSLFNKFKANTQYTIILKYSAASINNSMRISYSDGTESIISLISTSTKTNYVFITQANKTVSDIFLTYYSAGVVTVYYDESGIFEGAIPSTEVDSTFEPYNGTTYTIEFKDGDNPLTVYGGTLDVTSGVLTVTDAHITSYNGETLPSTWISDRDVYATGTTPTTGAQVCYTLENSVTYHLTPTQVRTLVGNNNIWADTGDIISGKYYKSLT